MAAHFSRLAIMWFPSAVIVRSLQQHETIDQRIAEETVADYVDSDGRDESFALEPLMRQFLVAVARHARTRKSD